MQPLFLLLDIDNNLYEYSETGFHHEMHDRIFEFAATKLNLSTTEAEALSQKYWRDYGLSLYGYKKEYNIDAKEYSDFVHQCSYEKLHYNAPLVEMLSSMQFNPDAAAEGGVDHLYYFTNANRAHARRVLEPQGLRPIFTRPRPAGSPIKECHRVDDAEGFEEDVEWLGFSYEDQWRLTEPDIANKPMQRAYEAIYKAIEEQVEGDVTLLAGAEDVATALNAQEVHSRRTHLHPRNVVMVDDSLMNLDAPLILGWSAVWYAHGSQVLPTDEGTSASAALYAEAVASGRLQVIYSILDLKGAVEKIREVNMKAAE